MDCGAGDGQCTLERFQRRFAPVGIILALLNGPVFDGFRLKSHASFTLSPYNPIVTGYYCKFCTVKFNLMIHVVNSGYEPGLQDSH